MANCLMQLNQCSFPNCSLHFANQYDLTAHIEYTHIPVIEEEVKRKKQIANANSNGEPPTQPAAMNLPLSYYSRVFRTAYRPNPIKPEPLKVSFNHYRKRSQKDKQTQPNQMASRILRDMMARQGRHISIEEAEKRLRDIDFEECGPENNEVRYRCAIVDCNKRYKSMFALRVHMKIVHNVLVSEDAKSLTNYPSEDIKPNLAALQQSMQAQMSSMPVDSSVSSGHPTTVPSNGSNTPHTQGSPAQSFGNPATNATSFKCSYCSKRYKTSSGLSNHMMSSHQKISDIPDSPSPQVVEQLISQVRMQSQQEQNSEKLTSQRTLSSSQSSSQTIGNASVHGRSFSVTTAQQPLRYTQQHYQVNLDNQPSTGQVLQMQMQHQKRMKQIQEQQAQAMAAAQLNPQQQISMQQGQYSSSNIGQMGQGSVHSVPAPISQHQQQHQQHQHHQQQQQQQHHHQQQQQQYQQQSNPYPQPIHQMAQQSPHPYQQYQQHQQSPQFPPFQQPSSQNHQANGQAQSSPVPLSQSLPPLSTVAQQQRQSVQQISSSNNGPMQFSPSNSSGFSVMASPSSNQLPPQPPPYNS
uniref:C2H2-type domain-containing protein n=1 Tax=Caenorhabditis tropicalis TaxID=1561998 RepID=A0A1I7TE62_9PELO